MTRWSWEPFFVADVPEGWHVTEGDGVVEATGPDEALQVSVLRKSEPAIPTRDDAEAVATTWAAKLSLEPTVVVVVGGGRALASFDVTLGRPWRRVRWRFRATLTEAGAVRASVNQTGRAIRSGHGDAVLESVVAFPATESLEAAMVRRFGTGWRVAPPLGEPAVARFEGEHGIRLPEPYRTFVTDTADGAAGPPHDGLLALGDHARMSAGPARPADLARPFPLVEPWVWEGDDDAGDEAVTNVRTLGILPLGTDGDGLDYVLVVTGEARGQVWEVTDVGAAPVARDFGEWIRG
jgi:hypothetical protein